jgi:hypothetical protein
MASGDLMKNITKTDVAEMNKDLENEMKDWQASYQQYETAKGSIKSINDVEPLLTIFFNKSSTKPEMNDLMLVELKKTHAIVSVLIRAWIDLYYESLLPSRLLHKKITNELNAYKAGKYAELNEKPLFVEDETKTKTEVRDLLIRVIIPKQSTIKEKIEDNQKIVWDILYGDNTSMRKQNSRSNGLIESIKDLMKLQIKTIIDPYDIVQSHVFMLLTIVRAITYMYASGAFYTLSDLITNIIKAVEYDINKKNPIKKEESNNYFQTNTRRTEKANFENFTMYAGIINKLLQEVNYDIASNSISNPLSILKEFSLNVKEKMFNLKMIGDQEFEQPLLVLQKLTNNDNAEAKYKQQMYYLFTRIKDSEFISKYPCIAIQDENEAKYNELIKRYEELAKIRNQRGGGWGMVRKTYGGSGSTNVSSIFDL